jgi:hypothetical protein
VAVLFGTYSATVLFLMEIAMQDAALRHDCIQFSQKLFTTITDPSVFGLTLRPVVALFLPYVTKFPNEITEILHRFVVGNRPATKTSFIDIAFIPVFAQQKELAEIHEVLSQERPETTD